MSIEFFFQLFCKFANSQNKTLGEANSSDASGHSIEILSLCGMDFVNAQFTMHERKQVNCFGSRSTVPRYKVTFNYLALTTSDHTTVC